MAASYFWPASAASAWEMKVESCCVTAVCLSRSALRAASASFSWSWQSSARLFRLRAVAGWFNPNTCSRIASARWKSGSASASLPWSW